MIIEIAKTNCPLCNREVDKFFSILDCDKCELYIDLFRDGTYNQVRYNGRYILPEDFKRIIKMKAFL